MLAALLTLVATLPPVPVVAVPGGAAQVGSDDALPEERPAHVVEVAPLLVGRTEVTNAQFARFVAATGYVSVAERRLDPADFPGVPPEDLVPGSVVFSPPDGQVRGWRDWWGYVPGASWRTPFGPGSRYADDEPVVHVALEDAEAFAAWVGGRLPSEAEWEHAARGGLVGARYAWGDEERPGPGDVLANHWQGAFPQQNLALDGFAGLAPVASFPPNGFGLFDVAGNAWEWTADAWTADHRPGRPGDPSANAIRGGSYLCAPSYCDRYRPSARTRGARDTGSSHLGFRVVFDPHRRPPLTVIRKPVEGRRHRGDLLAE